VRPARFALVLTVTLSGAARAETLGVLAVSDPPGPSGQLMILTGELRAALAALEPGVLSAAQLRERMAGRPAPSTLVELDRAYAGALAAHAAGEFEAGVRTLRAVIEDIERLPDSTEAFGQWTRAMLRLSRSEQEMGRRVEAQLLLERLLRAAPDLHPDPRWFPPSFMALVDEARERLRALGRRRLTVESHPEASVFIEGRQVGSTPLVLDVAPGRYRVSGVRGGVAAPAVIVDLTAEDRAVRLDLAIFEALRPDAGPGLALAPPERALGLVTAASRLGLDRAVVTTLARDGETVYLAATVHDTRRGRAEREARLRLVGGSPPEGGLGALAAFLLHGEPSVLISTPAGLSLVLRPPPPNPLAPPLPVQAPPSARGSKAYGWAAFGTGLATVAASGVTLALGASASSRYADARAMRDASGRLQSPHTVAEYNAAIRAGDSRRSMAVAVGVASGVGLVATAMLGYLGYRESGVIGPLRF
jgi:hypothetical protein